MMETWTIQKLLSWITEYLAGKGIDSPRLSGELLLSHVLGLQRIELYTQFDRPVAPPQLARLRELVKRAAEHEPIGYLIGRCEFYSLSIKVTRDCLIPRPETELLVEKAIEFLRQRSGPASVLDLCTGSGCIAVAIAKNVPEAELIATDISDAALQVAAENLARHQVQDRVKLLCGDLFDPIIQELDSAHFDLIVSNPPYVSHPEYENLDKNVRDFEPRLALDGGVDGLDVYRKIDVQTPEFLRANGALMLEIGYAQGTDVRHLLETVGIFKEIRIIKDLSQNDRIVTALR